jgi:hypothetical protein
MTTKDVSLDVLWNRAPVSGGVFSSERTAHLPEPARRLLEHAIAPNTRLASAVRLRMHGEIKVGRWLPFRAEQAIRRDGNMLWTATLTPLGLPMLRGFDRLVDGDGVMQWRLFGLFGIVNASGSDVSRSTVGRVQAESVWLPSLLCDEQVSWVVPDSFHVQATVPLGNASPIEFEIDSHGRIVSVRVARWGNPPPDTHHFRVVDFGGVVDQERTFGGYTIPTRVSVGWFAGSPEFENTGEFFRATIDDAVFN